MRRTSRAVFCLALALSRAAGLPDTTARAEESAVRAAVGPERPTEDSVQEAARTLFRAIVNDDAQLAEDVFFPRDAFVQVKAMQKPERYFDKLHARYVHDLHALHKGHPELAEASFVKLALGRRGGWVAPGEEGNRLGYWAARHTLLHYRVGGREQTLEVRVLITWQERWYVIHLSEFQ